MRHLICLCICGLTALATAQQPATRPNLVHDHHEHSHLGPLPIVLDPARFTTDRDGARPHPVPLPRDAFNFVIFGDRTGGPASGVNVLADAVRDTNLLDPDLVMTVGDLVQGYNETPEWKRQADEFKSIMKRLNAPWYPVAGNHDIYWRDKDRSGDTKPVGENEKNFEEHFGPLWYAFEHKKCWFIALFSDEGDPKTGEKNFNKPEANAISDRQFNWLKETLQKTKKAEHVFLFLHHPRWLGSVDMKGYGDSWERVHKLLVDAGNVSAVFAGHIHYMRHDPRDGIEYFALATVGGGQSGEVPQAGFLHQYHVVTVRKGRVSFTAYPVGAAMDPKEITGDLVSQTLKLVDERPKFDKPLKIRPDGSVEQTIRVSIKNPTTRPVEFTLSAESQDSRWSCEPNHHHLALEAGSQREIEFAVRRIPSPIDETLRMLEIVVDADYLARSHRYSMPRVSVPVPIDPDSIGRRPGSVLALDGNLALPVASADLKLKSPPFTIETRMRANQFKERNGLLCKTQNSGYGIFVNNGRPTCSVFLGDKYLATRAPTDFTLDTNRWYHIAQVLDGTELRLYVDGKLIAKNSREGVFKDNALPFLIGGDVEARGAAVDCFDGQLDAIRVSDIVRYTGDSFEVPKRHVSDKNTLLLLNMDRAFGPWVMDESPAQRMLTLPRGLKVVPGKEAAPAKGAQ